MLSVPNPDTSAQPVQPVPVQPVPVQPVPVQPVPPMQPVPVNPAYMPAPAGAVPAPDPNSWMTHLKVLESGTWIIIFCLWIVGGLYIKQKVEKFEAITGFETANRYKVYLTGPDCKKSKDQDHYFFAQEESECCQRQFCGNFREFDMKIYGPDKAIAMQLHRPFKCTCCCCNLPELTIQDGSSNTIGRVANIFSCCDDKFTIYDKNDLPVLTIHGDCCQPGKVCPMPFGPCAEY